MNSHIPITALRIQPDQQTGKNKAVPNLPVGQPLKAEVISVSKDEGIKLRIGQQMIQLNQPVALQKGDLLTVQINQTGKDISLTILKEVTSALTNNVSAGTAKPMAAPIVLSQVLQQQFQQLLQQSKPGQTIPAMLVKQDGALQLKINNLSLPLQASSNSLSEQKILLQSIQPVPDKQVHIIKLVTEQQINQLQSILKRDNLALQINAQAVLNNLKVLTDKGVDMSWLQDNKLKTLANQTLQHIPESKSFAKADAPMVKQALLNSGLFLENKLLTNPKQAINTDFKANLVKLINHLQTVLSQQDPTRMASMATQLASQAPASEQVSPPQKNQLPMLNSSAFASLLKLNSTLQAQNELLRQAIGGLARVQLQQALALPMPETPTQQLQLELPVQHGQQVHPFAIQIEEQEASLEETNKKKNLWVITMSFNLDQLGPMTAKITVDKTEETVSTQFWLERQESLKLIHEELAQFEDALVEEGLRIKEINIQKGRPAPPPAPPASDQQQPLLDIEV